MKFPLTVALLFFALALQAQTVSQAILPDVDPRGKYLFYLHGGVVTVKGDNAINDAMPQWGPYEYSNILDSLKKRGFNVISEMRTINVTDSAYAEKLVRQVKALVSKGVKIDSIIVVGASAGTTIAVLASSQLKSNKLKFVLMGGCWPDDYKAYRNIELYGKFLSIIEATDPHQTCNMMFKGRKVGKSFREITLHTGLSHGFIYRGLREWIDPVAEWSRK
jgi:hypothetical protein